MNRIDPARVTVVAPVVRFEMTKFANAWRTAACTALLGFVVSPASAQRGKPPVREWDVSMGAAAIIRPTFEGSDRYRARPLPFLTVNWRDAISFGENGLTAQLRREKFRLGVGLTFDAGRADHGTGGLFASGDDRLKGMGEIDFSLGFRGFAAWRLGPVELNASATKFDGKQNDGLLATLGLSAPLPLGQKLMIIPSIRATWADDKYTQTYFGVTSLQASRSIFPRFDAHSGLQDVRANVNMIYRFNRHWFVGANVGVSQMMGDSAKSPISISDTSSTGLALIGYRF